MIERTFFFLCTYLEQSHGALIFFTDLANWLGVSDSMFAMLHTQQSQVGV